MINKSKFIPLFALILLFLLALAACGGGEEVESETAVSDTTTVEEPEEAVADEPEAEETTAEEAVADEAEEVAEAPAEEAAPAETAGLDLANAEFFVYSNSNDLMDTAVYDGKQWGAGIGGVVAYDLTSGEAHKYTTLDGLPHGASFAIDVCPTPELALVVGTHEGLAIYDPASDSFVSGDDIYAADGRIFALECTDTTLVAYDDGAGVAVYHADSGAVDFYDKEAIDYATPRNITITDDTIWLAGDYSGSASISGGSATLLNLENGNVPSDVINTVAVAPNGDLWFGANEGLFKVTASGETAVWDKDNNDEIGFSGPSVLAFAPDGSLWVGIGSALCQWDMDNGGCLTKFQGDDGMVTDTIRHIDFDAEGGIYLQTNFGGMSAFNGGGWTHHMLEGEFPTNMVQDVVQDVDGAIWTVNGSLYRTDLEASAWEKFDALGDDMVADPNGGVWAVSGPVLFYANATDGVTRYSAEEGLLDSFGRTVEIDDQGRVWVGQEKGISIFDGNSFTILDEAAGWPEGIVSNLLFDDGTMWASTTKGLIKIDSASLSWEIVFDEANTGGVSQPTFGDMEAYEDGYLVVATGGLYFFDGSTLTQFEGAGCSIGEVEVDESNNVWLNCFDGLFDSGGGELSDKGVYVYTSADGEWTSITTADGLMNASVRGILTDSTGAIWLVGGDTSNGGGILRIVP